MGVKNKKLSIGAALTVFLFILAAYSFGTGGTFYYIEYPLRDALSARNVWQRAPEPSIKLIKIDARSLERVGRFPWDRSVYAEVINKLGNAKVKGIGLDVTFPEPSQESSQDEALAQALSRYPHVILPVNFVFPPKQQSSLSLEYDRIEAPTERIGAADSQLGHINVFPDIDSRVRSLIVGLPKEDGVMIEAFSVKLANLALSEEEKVSWDPVSNRWYRGSALIPTNGRHQVITPYYTEPRQDKTLYTGYDSFSFIDVLDGTIDPLLFEQDIVLIGPYATGLQDEYLTPVSRVNKMFGVEIHANMVQALLENNFWKEARKPYGAAVIGLIVLVALLLFERFRGKAGLLAFIGMLLLYLIVFVLAGEAFRLLLPLVYPLLAIILMYSWSIVGHYIAERRERSRVTDIFGRFVPKTVVDRMLTSGEEVKLSGERMDVSLVFVDIRGFTTLSEKLEPEQVIQFLNEYLDVCTKAVFKYNGTLDKFIGDGVMAIFGAPIRYDNHAELAVRAALEMKKQAAALEERLMEKLGFTVRFGIGINSGPAIVGNIGSEGLRLDYTAIGDTVNLAARLESNAKPGQILISSAVYERVGLLFEIEPIGEIKVKGKEQPVSIYEVHAGSSDKEA